MSYLDNSGLSYFWSKLKALLAGKMDKDADLIVKVNPVNATGTAQTGIAQTEAPNYTPSGGISPIMLDYEYKDGKLYIYGITQPRFVGGGVKLIIKEEE